jgi:peptide chain release factor subunit 1
MSSIDQLNTQLDRLATIDSCPFPVISLYLDLRPDERGRDRFEPFLKKELTDRVRTYPADGAERESLGTDAERIRDYVAGIDPAVNGLALFVCGAIELFEAIELAAPIDTHRLFISDRPHLYPLARLLDEYPRYAALLTDSHSARIFVFATNTLEKTEEIEGVKTRQHKKGGWSQARYQRHIENFHVQHAKEVVDTLGRIIRDEKIDKVVVAADAVIAPLLREQFPKEIDERIVDYLKLDVRAPEREVLEATIAALREQDAVDDRERVDKVIGAYRGNGLASVGIEEVKLALERGQVEELVIAAAAEAIESATLEENAVPAERTAEERTADELVALARQTSARIRFIQDQSLLAPVGGVGAFLRYKL